jgi:hypothetical protein
VVGYWPNNQFTPDFGNADGVGAMAWNSFGEVIDGYIIINSNNGAIDTSTLQGLITHEVGHLLGIAHSDVNESIMFANPYHNYDYQRVLRQDDIDVARLIYSNVNPNAFAFTDQINVDLSTLIISNSITINGISNPVSIGITGGEYEINGDNNWLTATSTINNNQTVRVRQTSSATNATTTNILLTVGGVSDTFSVTTLGSKINLNIDGSTGVNALTDGVLVVRYLFGFRGNTLIDGVVANGIQASDVENALAAMNNTFDIDGNGQVDALTDGILLIRYLFGFTGNTLIDSAIGINATRITATEIENYIVAHFSL